MEQNKHIYTSPMAKVLEIKTRQMLCQSKISQTPGLTNDDESYDF